jgi:hypothetical protein
MIPRIFDDSSQKPSKPDNNNELTFPIPATGSEELHNFHLTASNIVDLGYVGFASLDLLIDSIHGRSSTCRRLSPPQMTCASKKMLPLRLDTNLQMHGTTRQTILDSMEAMHSKHILASKFFSQL